MSALWGVGVSAPWPPVKWIDYWVEHLEQVVVVQVRHEHLHSRFELPAEILHTNSGKTEFMRIAFAHKRKLVEQLTAQAAVTKALLK